MHPNNCHLIKNYKSFYYISEFNLTPGLKQAIENAVQVYEANTSALQVDVLESDVFGKNSCKKHKVSPDAMMQLGFQVSVMYTVNKAICRILIYFFLFVSVLIFI